MLMKPNNFKSRLLGNFECFLDLILRNSKFALRATSDHFVILSRSLVGVNPNENLFSLQFRSEMPQSVKGADV